MKGDPLPWKGGRSKSYFKLVPGGIRAQQPDRFQLQRENGPEDSEATLAIHSFYAKNVISSIEKRDT